MIGPITLSEVTDYLRGTCNSIADTAELFKVDPDELETAIAEAGEIQLCETCSWWEEVDELDENGNCKDCSEE